MKSNLAVNSPFGVNASPLLSSAAAFTTEQTAAFPPIYQVTTHQVTTHQNALHTNNGNVSDAFDAQSRAPMTPPIADVATIAN